MSPNPQSFIDALVDDLQPVKPISIAQGMTVAAMSLAVTFMAVIALVGLEWDFSGFAAHPVYVIATGSFLLLGAVAAGGAVAQSKPQVGSDHSGWKWAATMLVILPVAALVSSLGNWRALYAADATLDGLGCVMAGSGFGLLTFAALTAWQRGGAPTSPERAGLLTGIAAGCFGIAAFSLSCTHSDIIHIGIWHTAAVAACAGLGRLVVPRLLRW